jgi:hypothetical protein
MKRGGVPVRFVLIGRQVAPSHSSSTYIYVPHVSLTRESQILTDLLFSIPDADPIIFAQARVVHVTPCFLVALTKIISMAIKPSPDFRMPVCRP